MTLATEDDANVWLDNTKIEMFASDMVEIAPQIDAEVAGQLINLYPTYMEGWLGGTNVPSVIVDIASRLYAATLYDKKYSEETQEPNPYAERLRAQAQALIEQIQALSLSLYDSNGIILPVATGETELDFWPNDRDVIMVDEHGNIPSGFSEGDTDIKFTTDAVF